MHNLTQIGGVVLPNDGRCRMNGTTAPLDYNDWITLDYPSVGQIAQALRDNEIIPIFAAQASPLSLYKVIYIIELILVISLYLLLAYYINIFLFLIMIV